jgi:two-component system, NarL family, sensor kinase
MAWVRNMKANKHSRKAQATRKAKTSTSCVETRAKLEGTYGQLLEAMSEGAATLEQNGTVLYANARFADMLNADRKKLIGSSLFAHVWKEQRQHLTEMVRKATYGEQVVEITLQQPTGRRMQVRLTLSPVGGEKPQRINLIALELTELLEANEALKHSEEALRQLSGRLLQLQDEERRRIARDLHDVTGQKMAFQTMTLSQLLNPKTNLSQADVEKKMAECLSLAHEVGGEIRTLSYLLHPPLLDELGLSSAAQWYMQGFQGRTGIHVDLEMDRDFPRLKPESEVALFRVMQESLTNVHRYSGSEKALVTVHRKNGEFHLEVIDYGKGMTVEKLRSIVSGEAALGVGIQGMRERLRQLSGRLEIFSPQAGGTCVSAMLPASALRQDPAEEMHNLNGSQTAKNSANREKVANGRKHRILIADDHEVLRRGVRTMLEAESNLEICGEAMNGQDVIQKALQLLPDLVILDINMPLMNGLAAMRRVLKNLPQMKVLIFSVHDSEQTIRESRAAGARGYVSKGRASQDLLRAVSEVLSGGSFYVSGATVAAN